MENQIKKGLISFKGKLSGKMNSSNTKNDYWFRIDGTLFSSLIIYCQEE
jgi:hypothetical protein